MQPLINSIVSPSRNTRFHCHDFSQCLRANVALLTNSRLSAWSVVSRSCAKSCRTSRITFSSRRNSTCARSTTSSNQTSIPVAGSSSARNGIFAMLCFDFGSQNLFINWWPSVAWLSAVNYRSLCRFIDEIYIQNSLQTCVFELSFQYALFTLRVSCGLAVVMWLKGLCSKPKGYLFKTRIGSEKCHLGVYKEVGNSKLAIDSAGNMWVNSLLRWIVVWPIASLRSRFGVGSNTCIKGWSVKPFVWSDGLAFELYQNILLPFTFLVLHYRCQIYVSGFSTRLRLTAITLTRATTVCRLSVMQTFSHCIAYSGLTRRRLATTCLAAGMVVYVSLSNHKRSNAFIVWLPWRYEWVGIWIFQIGQ